MIRNLGNFIISKKNIFIRLEIIFEVLINYKYYFFFLGSFFGKKDILVNIGSNDVKDSFIKLELISGILEKKEKKYYYYYFKYYRYYKYKYYIERR